MNEGRCESCGGPLTSPAEGEAFCPLCLLQEGLTLDESAGGDEGELAAVDPIAIGPYRIVRRLGEGGMGVVYLAEQTGELERQVAVKLIKLGVNSKQVVARFRMEQQSLALMDHRGIARIYDAGTAADGQPYFVMEYVDGTTITEYCDTHRLPNAERVRLFLEVCQAVQHAHQRGVIHRDLKPSNILVADGDDGPQVKIIDFGVAKATEKRFLEWSVFTEIGKLVGTPVYMSPEQAGDSEGSVDTRSDVYSLGVVLYELLVGTTPIDEDSLRGAGLRAILETVQKATFPTPSSRAESLGDASAEAAAVRSTNISALSRQLRGELDWIVMRALERDVDRRFRSPGELADDLRRYLADEPVESSPPGAWYRLGKTIRKHRVAVTVAGSLVAALVIAVVGISVGLVRAQRAEAEARRQAEIAEATHRFLNQDLLEAVAPEMEGRDVRVIDLIDRAGEQIDTRFPDSPLTRAAIHRTVGRADTSLGRLDEAEPHLLAALELFRAEHGDRHRETATAMCDLGAYYGISGDPTKGLELSRAGLAILEELPGIPDEELLERRREIALMTGYAGDEQGSFEQLQELLPDARERLGDAHEVTIFVINDLAIRHSARREVDRAEELSSEAVRLHTALKGPDHAHTLSMESNLAGQYVRRRDYETAAGLYAALTPRFERVFGDEHPRTLTLKGNYAVALSGLKRHDEAATLQLELIDRRTRLLGPMHRNTIGTHYSYARTAFRQKNYAAAAEHFRIALERRLETIGDEHLLTITSASQLAAAEGHLGKIDEAIARHRWALDRREHFLETQAHLVAAMYGRYGYTLEAAGRIDEAIEAFGESIRWYEKQPDLRVSEREAMAERRQRLIDG